MDTLRSFGIAARRDHSRYRFVWKDHFRRRNPAATRRGFDVNVPILTSARAARHGR
jgi:hypothetical protein